jgi:hypothetical protein
MVKLQAASPLPIQEVSATRNSRPFETHLSPAVMIPAISAQTGRSLCLPQHAGQRWMEFTNWFPCSSSFDTWSLIEENKRAMPPLFRFIGRILSLPVILARVTLYCY